MSNERKPGLSAEPAGSEPKVSEPNTREPEAGVPKVFEPLVRRFFLILESIIFRDTIKLFGWIASILIIAGLCWTLTQPARSRFLIRAVNRVLEQYGDSRRVSELASPIGDTALIGSWYTMINVQQPGILFNEYFSEGTEAFIFSFVAEGTFFPCAAIVDPMGQVQEFIALNMHGKKILDRISPGILKLYIRRIEGSES